jgi:cell division septum initiation protein DivIVA
MNNIEKLFEQKVKPQIAGELKQRDEVAATLKQIEADRADFMEKIKATERIISDLEAQIDQRIIAGKSADDLLVKLGTEKAKIAAFNRHIQRLTDAEVESTIALRDANQRLSEALGAAIDSLRGDVQTLLETALNGVLAVCVSFEGAGHQAERVVGVEIPKQKDREVYRFPCLYQGIFRDLEAFLSPIGDDLSAIRRREVLELWTAGHDKKEAA